MTPVIIILVILPILIVIFVFLWLLLSKQINKTTQLNEKHNILEKEQEHASALISEATKKAEKILHETEFFAKKAHQDLDHALQKTIQIITENNENHINEIMHHYDRVAVEINEETKQMAEEKITSFASQIHNQIKTTTEEIDKITAQEILKVKESLAEFEKQKRVEIEDELNEKVATLTKDITRKAIPEAEHERLVKEALSKAAINKWS